MTTERKRILEIAVIVAVILACALALATLGGCAANTHDWKPVVGERFTAVCEKINPGTKFITYDKETCEVRWWLEDPRTATHWVYYARFDSPLMPDVKVKIGEKVQYNLSQCFLVEWTWNTRAYPDAPEAGSRIR